MDNMRVVRGKKIISLGRTEMSKSVKFNTLLLRWDLPFAVPANISRQNTWTLFSLHQSCPFWAESSWARSSMGTEFCSSTESSRMMLIYTRYGSGSQHVSARIHKAWSNVKQGSDFCEKHFGKENQKWWMYHWGRGSGARLKEDLVELPAFPQNVLLPSEGRGRFPQDKCSHTKHPNNHFVDIFMYCHIKTRQNFQNIWIWPITD